VIAMEAIRRSRSGAATVSGAQIGAKRVRQICRTPLFSERSSRSASEAIESSQLGSHPARSHFRTGSAGQSYIGPARRDAARVFTESAGYPGRRRLSASAATSAWQVRNASLELSCHAPSCSRRRGASEMGAWIRLSPRTIRRVRRCVERRAAKTSRSTSVGGLNSKARGDKASTRRARAASGARLRSPESPARRTCD
jgi:hypothetical protein